MNPLQEWTCGNTRPRWWMGYSHYSAERDRYLYVAFPLNHLVALAWWAHDLCCRKLRHSSWIDGEVEERVERRRL